MLSQGDAHAKRAISCPVYVRQESDEQYLSLLEANLDKSIKSFEPDFLLYNAGTDVSSAGWSLHNRALTLLPMHISLRLLEC